MYFDTPNIIQHRPGSFRRVLSLMTMMGRLSLPKGLKTMACLFVITRTVLLVTRTLQHNVCIYKCTCTILTCSLHYEYVHVHSICSPIATLPICICIVWFVLNICYREENAHETVRRSPHRPTEQHQGKQAQTPSFDYSPSHSVSN